MEPDVTSLPPTTRAICEPTAQTFGIFLSPQYCNSDCFSHSLGSREFGLNPTAIGFEAFYRKII